MDKWWVSTILLVGLLTVVVLLWHWIPTMLNNNVTDLSERGQYGDSYGSVNALFTGLAFAGLIFTILLQQREIKLQREDFSEQLNEMQMSREEVARQSEILERQLALTEKTHDLGRAELQFKIFDARISELEMKSYAWNESGRAKHSGSAIEAVVKQMEQQLKELDSQWENVDNNRKH